MFRLMGVVVALYTISAIIRGEVYARDGPGGRTVSRIRSPEYFWTVIATYAALSIALIAFF